jgi:membrane-associated phospholipid phosphatase
LKSFLKHNAIVLSIYLLSVLIAFFFIWNVQKTHIHLYVNHFVGNRAVDAFFYYITYLGDGRIAGILLLLILLYNVRTGIYAVISFLSATIVSNSLKYFFFDDMNRPSFTFNFIEKTTLNLVDGVDIHLHNSFPSGHATQAFSILMVVAFMSPKNTWKITFLAIAILTAFSRVYLSQHWLVDITVGSIIGTGFALLYYSIFISQNKLSKLNHSLYTLRSSK